MALRLMVYDRNRSAGRFLVSSWKVGGRLYGSLGRIDACYGAADWDDALAWLGSYRAPEPIAEVQFWGHGKFGEARIGQMCLDATLLDSTHHQHAALCSVKQRLIPGTGLWWFRTCSTFATKKGH